MTFSQRIEAVRRKYHDIMTLHQQAEEQPTSAELLDVALQDMDTLLEELQTAYEEIDRQKQALAYSYQKIEVERYRFQELFNFAPDGYLVTNARGVIQQANMASAALLGIDQKFLVGKPLSVFFSTQHYSVIYTTLERLADPEGPDDSPLQAWETQICPHGGSPLDVGITLSGTRRTDGTIIHLLWQLRDITRQKQAEAKIHRQAFYDALTGLPNRALLETYFPKALAQAQRQNLRVAVGFIDLDRFKGINDTFGHSIGDTLLEQAGQRIQNCLREEDLLVRWGGDEFIMVLASVEGKSDAGVVCDRILKCLDGTFIVKHHELQVGMSFGVALFPNHGEDLETLLRHADQALYQAKSLGRNTYRFYKS
jgi:diguanylate cyclase (GGDEF)-like protein/PAS domain S-box-containing protein